MAAIRVEGCTDAEITGNRIVKCGKGIEIINSTANLSGNKISDTIIAVDIHNSDVVMQDNILLDNVIDMAVESSNVKVINSIANKVILEAKNLKIQQREKIINLAFETKKAKNIADKKRSYRKLLKCLQVAKDVAVICALLKALLELAGVLG